MPELLDGRERVVSRAEFEVVWGSWTWSEHSRDRGDECACASCAADDLDMPPMEAAIRRASLVGDRDLVARLRVAIEAARRRRRA